MYVHFIDSNYGNQSLLYGSSTRPKVSVSFLCNLQQNMFFLFVVNQIKNDKELAISKH